MGQPPRRLWLLVPFVLTACTGIPASTPAASPTESSAAIPDLRASCTPIDLRTPEGQTIDLSGVWAARPPEVGFFLSSTETTWIRQQGRCVWAAIMDAEFRADPDYQGTISARGGNLGTFQGLVSDDFVVVGTLTAIRIGNPFSPSAVAPIRLRIGFEPGSQISLREDQDPEELAARCYLLPEGDSFCPDQVILFRVGDASGS